ncbi:MAG: UDP-N-acetylenolpyruvoylglucosamine reductase [Candidatus Wolfebacteria bacterium GW2011_GWC1_43_10]|uniref:UDP-N-acetylenolpyruvoylglucosamine reductase n=2 Tax=Candidatus Wolfeibacteriota TaxID=1752735 RepID=A0A0G1EJB0_9BACT|nr:MAG: UDP-N-acetylenolpyruvoylglucosamine reductase [Candidatus Wolfebacteria bacterium GW2011_GWC1_43_10]KKT22737.1 MAG: UDP-N-acetylenolpyruvoylglucosamine reductase [Parcubacteria group bacterium GW2011_GWB1_43_8b]OGM89763.1 MAG: UDP-N-acetylenolpyruvoylglucosamine reductase [Candidatus Wolfebacteria bacterium GWA1_42_9]
MEGIRRNVLLKNYSGYKIGGPADFFCEPKSRKDIISALNFASIKKVPIFVLGGGFNVLISDDGFRGLVIKPTFNSITFKGREIIAGAGVNLDKLIKTTLNRGFVGLEDFSGIPGTVGGALFINIHYYKMLIGNFVKWVECINFQGETRIINFDDKDWKYEFSKIQKDKLTVFRACFKLKNVGFREKWKAIGKSEEIIRTRHYKYPQEPSAGSVFQNLDKEKFYGAPSISAAYYIDSLGMKGKRIGGAEISGRHANIIINRGGATAKNVIKLASMIKKRVKRKFGIEFKPEVQFVGFKSSPF